MKRYLKNRRAGSHNSILSSSAYQTGEKNNHRRPGVKLVVIVIPLLLLLGAIGLVIRGLSAPAEGSINQAPPTLTEQKTPYSQPGSYSGKYISFSYPAHFKKIPTKLSGSFVEIASYTSTDQSFIQISVGVMPGSITDNGAVLYRQQHPDLYSHLTSKIGLEFTKLDGTEDTIFIARNGLLASVSATCPYKNLNGEALFVASSLQWK